MAINLSAKGKQTEEDFGGGNLIAGPGKFHVIVEKADDSCEKKDQVIVDFTVYAGTDAEQIGRSIREWFSLTDKALPRLTRLAFVLGLIEPDEEKYVDFAEAEGRQCVIEVEAHSYEKDGEKKSGFRISYMGMWSVYNPAVADVPKDAKLLKPAPAGAAMPASEYDDV